MVKRIALIFILLLCIVPFISSWNFESGGSSTVKLSTTTTTISGNLTNLSQMADVNIPTPTDTYVLTYQASTGKWIDSLPSAGAENDPKAYNGTLAKMTDINSSGFIRNWNITGYIKDWNISTYLRDWNSTSLIKDWNSTGLIQNYSKIITGSGSETDPLAYNGTLAYNVALTSLYNKSNPFGFYNSTSFSIADYYLKSNPFGFYNSTNPQIEVDSKWTGNYSNTPKLNNHNNFTLIDSIMTFNGNSSMLGGTPASGGIRFVQTIPSAKDGIWWEAYDRTADSNQMVGWFVCHYNSSSGGTPHSHCSIETLDNTTGIPSMNSHLEIAYGSNLSKSTVTVSSSDFVVGSIALFNTTGKIKMTPNTTFEVYPSGQTTYALQISNNSGNITFTGLGVNDLEFLDNGYFNNKNVTALYYFGDGRYLSNLPAGTESDPKAYNGTLAYVSGLVNYNSTGLIKDWNISTYLRNWNSTNLIIDWNISTYLRNWNSTELIKNWNVTGLIVNYSLIPIVESDSKAYNGTLRYTNNDTFNFNSSFAGNISIGNFCIVNQTATGRGSICHNGTGWVIKG